MPSKNKICVICHVFYQNMWEKIYKYLLNLQEISGFDLYLTFAKENPELFDKIKNSFNENVNISIEIIDNPLGADIQPFLHILNKINLDEYDFVYKLHTKQIYQHRNVKLPKPFKAQFYIGKDLWFEFLFNAILGKKNIKNVIEAFNKDSKIGCIGFDPLLLESLNKTKTHHFYAGTIFVIRANILKCIQNKYSHKDFENKPEGYKFAIVTGNMEVQLGAIVEDQGYTFGHIGYNKKWLLELLAHKTLAPIYEWYVRKYVIND